jgi:hypothetical protein
MNKKVKIPSYNHSDIVIDKNLNGKITLLESNAEYQALHNKLRSLLNKPVNLVLE